MIIGIGIDIVEIARIEEAIRDRGQRFVDRVFTPAEIAECDSKATRIASLAARFAAKEAAMKALGTGWAGGLAWRDIEVICEPGGRPSVRFHGRAAEVFRELGGRTAHVSLSHAGDLAAAQVVIDG